MPFTWVTSAPPLVSGSDDVEQSGVLFELYETYKNLVASIRLEPDEGELNTVTGYQYSIYPPPPSGILTISTGGDIDGILITAPTLGGLFPIEFVDYLENGDVIRVDEWSKVPLGVEIVEFRPSLLVKFEFTLTVIATTLLGAEYIASYKMIVLHDWTPGQIKLLEYVDASRSTNR